MTMADVYKTAAIEALNAALDKLTPAAATDVLQRRLDALNAEPPVAKIDVRVEEVHTTDGKGNWEHQTVTDSLRQRIKELEREVQKWKRSNSIFSTTVRGQAMVIAQVVVEKGRAEKQAGELVPSLIMDP